jgi:PAS domain S-box-containing protein
MAETSIWYLGYLSWLGLSAVVTMGIGWWVFSRTEVTGRRWFAIMMAVDACWAADAAVELWVSDPTLTSVALYGRFGLAVTSPVLWVAFTTVYTGRSLSLRRRVNAGLVAGYGLTIAALLTHPIHRSYWGETTRHTEPFQYVEVSIGPLYLFGSLFAFAAIGVGIYHLTELFMKTRHRSSTSVFVLLLGAGASAVPYGLAQTGLVPVVGYDHTALGILPFVVPAAYAIFGLGVFDIAPVARDQLVDDVEDAMFVVDTNARLVDYNRAAADIAPALPDDPIGMGLETVFPTLAAETDLTDGATGSDDHVSVVRDDQQRHYSVLVTPIDGDGDVVGYSIILRDITDIEQYRRELERQNDQLDQFASTVSHDLRNPLQVAGGHSESLAEQLTDRETIAVESVERHLDPLVEALDRMEDIVADLRTLAKMGKTVQETEPVTFGAAVEDAWSLVETDGATYQVASDGVVDAERSRLSSILENLVRNAVEHGCPDWSVDGDEEATGAASLTVEFGLTADGFYVADDGTGIPPEDAERVFSDGYTTVEDGTGLGLSIVETMAESHGWSVSLDPEYDAGARFVFTDAVTEPAD